MHAKRSPPPLDSAATDSPWQEGFAIVLVDRRPSDGAAQRDAQANSAAATLKSQNAAPRRGSVPRHDRDPLAQPRDPRSPAATSWWTRSAPAAWARSGGPGTCAPRGRDSSSPPRCSAAHDSGMLLRFVREQSVRIQHPHVVAPTGWAAEDHLVVFTMDLVRGGSVQTLLGEHGPLPEAYVAVSSTRLSRRSTAVHAAGVVHRDVKPANLLLEATGTAAPHVRLGDFGVAARSTTSGSPASPAPSGPTATWRPSRRGRPARPAPGPVRRRGRRRAAAHRPRPGPRAAPAIPDGSLRPLLEALVATDPDRRPPRRPRPSTVAAARRTSRRPVAGGRRIGARRSSGPSQATCWRRVRARGLAPGDRARALRTLDLRDAALTATMIRRGLSRTWLAA